jgi:hypothetical protein
MHQTPIVAEQTDHEYHGWHGHLEGEIDSLRTGITDAGYNLIRVIRGSPLILYADSCQFVVGVTSYMLALPAKRAVADLPPLLPRC